MALQFSGDATRIDDDAVEAAAEAIGCSEAAVRAVIDVESRGGFLPDRRPKILFERHYFCRLTNHKHDDHPEISNARSGGYKGGAAEYLRLEQAMKLDREAALRSASWGAFQIMGNNYEMCGFDDVEQFVKAMVEGEPEQLQAFILFVKNARLDDELRKLDWTGFARGYNGPKYRENRYDEKLAAAYRFHNAGGPRTRSPHPVLRMGDTGEDVALLQARLELAPDGDFGPITKAAVIAFQRKNGLFADGIVGPSTWAKLGIG